MNINIILSAKLVDLELQTSFGKIPSALIPFSNTVALDEIQSRSRQIYDQVYVLVYENKQLIKDYIHNKKTDVKLIELDKLSSLGYSVYYALEYILEEHKNVDNVTVSFGDTLVSEAEYSSLLGMNSFLYDTTFDAERWTTFSDDERFEINDKSSNQEKIEYNTFVGIFNFKNVLEFKLILKDTLERYQVGMLEPFFAALKILHSLKMLKSTRTKGWIDLGHEDLYYQGKKDVAARYFNSITIDKKRGILKKTSTDKDKFRNEIMWYLKLPTDLQYLSPRIFEYSLEYDRLYIEMEYYGYNTLHETYLYGNHSLEKWRKIIKNLLDTYSEFEKYQLHSCKEEIRDSIRNVYYKKTVTRLGRLEQENRFIEFFKADKIRINDIEYENINYYLSRLDELLERSNIYNLDHFNIIHGDYFFANILYDMKTDIIRLIDPRGDFGGKGIYGDSRYDIAKLAHSIMGDYDFIVEDLFEFNADGNFYNYKIYTSDIHIKIKNEFESLLKKRNDYHEILIIEALLFLSMVPLHEDHPKRQILMLCLGIEKIDRAMKFKP